MSYNSKENRRHRRVNLKCRVEITHPSFGKRVVEAKDFSDSGLFLCIDESELPPIGTVLQGQVQGISGEEAPIIDMQVVRSEQGGVGLRFVDGKSPIH